MQHIHHIYIIHSSYIHHTCIIYTSHIHHIYIHTYTVVLTLTLATKSFKANDPQAAKITTSLKMNEGSILQLPILSANMSWPEFWWSTIMQNNVLMIILWEFYDHWGASCVITITSKWSNCIITSRNLGPCDNDFPLLADEHPTGWCEISHGKWLQPRFGRGIKLAFLFFFACFFCWFGVGFLAFSLFSSSFHQFSNCFR